MPNYLTELSPDNDAHVYQIKDKEAAPIDLLKDTVGWTGKNLITLPYAVDSYTQNGVTISIDHKTGIIKLNGTATALITAVVHYRANYSEEPNPTVLPTGNYIISKNDVNIAVDVLKTVNGSASVIKSISEIETSGNFSIAENTQVGLRFIISSGVSFSNKEVYLMIRDASILDDTYEPYHKSVEEVVEQVYADNGVLGAKNRFAYPYPYTSKTENGITFTDNGDGSITISGTASADATFQIANRTASRWLEEYIGRSVIVSGGLSENVAIKMYVNSISDPFYNSGGETIFTVPSQISNNSWNIYIRVKNGADLSTPVTVKPMLRLATDPDSTYQPYAMTNRELTEMMTPIMSEATDIVEGASVSSDIGNTLWKIGRQVYLSIGLASVTSTSLSTNIFKIPEGFRPPKNIFVAGNQCNVRIDTSGNVKTTSNLSNSFFQIATSWIVD